MKLCINCVHFWAEDGRQAKYALCKRVEAPRSPVTGLHDGDPYPYCSVARETPCGASARFYEEKEVPVTEEEEEAWQDMDETCPVCKQDTMCLAGNGNYFKCATCGNYRKTQQEEL